MKYFWNKKWWLSDTILYSIWPSVEGITNLWQGDSQDRNIHWKGTEWWLNWGFKDLSQTIVGNRSKIFQNLGDGKSLLRISLTWKFRLMVLSYITNCSSTLALALNNLSSLLKCSTVMLWADPTNTAKGKHGLYHTKPRIWMYPYSFGVWLCLL